MFCGKCGNELKEGAKFCDKCGTATGVSEVPFQQPVNVTGKAKLSVHKIVIISVIMAVIIIAVVVVIILVNRSGKDDTASKSQEPDSLIETEINTDDITSDLPELAPDSEEEYEALFDKLEYITLGE